jgi:hypothetical protein
MEFVEFFRQLESLGLTDALLPFLLLFTILFAVLQKSKLLGKDKRNFNIIVATTISLMVVIPHVTGSYPPNKDAIELINSVLPQVSIIIVAVLMALLLIGVFGGSANWMGGSLSGWIAILAFGIIIYIFGAEANIWANLPQKFSWWGTDTSSLVIIILVFAVIIWYITKEPSASDKAAGFSEAIGSFGDMFKNK